MTSVASCHQQTSKKIERLDDDQRGLLSSADQQKDREA